MTWQEAMIAAVAIAAGTALIITVLLQASGVIRAFNENSRERRYRELAEQITEGQALLRGQLTDIQGKVDETERRVREVD